jgi:hypothetical protein
MGKHRTRFELLLTAALLAGLAASAPVYAQGFGHPFKKKIILQRRLPSAVRLEGSKISVKVTAENSKYTDVAKTLRDSLETELLKNGHQLSVDDAHPDVLVEGTITELNAPAPQQVTRKVASEKGLVDQQFLEISGAMRVAYQAIDKRSGRTEDAYNVAEAYQHEVEGQGAGNVGTKTYHDLKTQFGKIKPGKKESDATSDPDLIQTPAQVVQVMMQREVKDIASRLVDTSETVEVLLGRGKLDEANRLADQGLWSRMAEELETMKPFPKPDDDAYRLYNLGVAYEAMAYAAKDPKAAKNFLEQAAINYGKAVDDNKGEKYFLEPQTRIETAAAHYRVIEERASAPAPPPAAPSPAAPAPSSGRASSSSPAHASSGPGSGSSAHKAAAASSNTSSAGSKPLTNQDVIDMAKAGMDDDNLIANIKEAKSVSFDLSTQAQIELVHNGVKGKVLTAMRARSRRSSQ